ncbi:MAG: PspC domain-containing protein [Prevotellaceae bacterium]|jgi:phage shock protein PspC (stress-responsive transcriptional regulator)|nr:PspC domain-containing protein [Prevotellaceae bacterium]
MKKVININVGGVGFTIEEDAYLKLKNYLDRFESTFADKFEALEVMEDIESRIADILRETIKYDYQVVDLKLVEKVIAQMGQPEGAPAEPAGQPRYNGRPRKRLYRNPDDSMISGLCGGLAAYLGVDSSIIRIVTLLGVIFAGLSIWVYIILWIVVPRANTIAEKLEMRGEPVTAENIRNYSSRYK